MANWRITVTISGATVPTAAVAAAPVYFDLGGLILTVLAVSVGLILLLASLASRSSQLRAIGLVFILVPLAWLVVEPMYKQLKRKAASEVLKADKDAHRSRFAAFCGDTQRRVDLLTEDVHKYSGRAALMVKCNGGESSGFCYGLDKLLEHSFRATEGVGCRNTSVGAIYREFRDLHAPCCKMQPSVIVPVCGSESRDPGAYETYKLSTRILRSEYHNGKGPMSRAGFYEIELTLTDAVTTKSLATAVFFRAVNAGFLDYQEQVCPSFEDAAVDLASAVLQKH